MKLLGCVAWIMAAGVLASIPAGAQTWDPTGNSQLSGTYYFREVLYPVGDQSGDLSDGISVYGGITFDGNGSYSVKSSSSSYLYDASQGSVVPFVNGGTYTISASGHGFINWTNPLLGVSYTIRVLVSNGLLIGSSTDNSYSVNEMFLAAPIASPQLTASAFNGSYSLVYFNPVSGSISSAYDALLSLNANGSGGIGTVNITAYIGTGGSSPISLSESGVTYTFRGGAAVVNFPITSNGAVTGLEYLYFSPDQNFVFGGSPTNGDLIVGVRTGSTPDFGGFYYQAGLNVDESQAASGYGVLSDYYGSLSASNGKIVGHQRLASAFYSPYDYTSAGSYSSGGNYTDTITSAQYIMGNGGVRIGFGLGPYLGIDVAIPAPGFTPSSAVYLSPIGVVNAASSAPFTAAISPGELITLYGTGLASSAKVASSTPFPTTLNGVQVLVNNIPAPVYVVSSGQVSAIVPYGVTGSIAQVQVVNNNVKSNAVTMYVGATSPGVFTNPAGGLGDAAALHADYSLVSPNHPAQIGETISVFVTGLGAVFPAIPDGDVGPSDQLSKATGTIVVNVDGQAATVTYAGLAPQLAGLYQINFTVPGGVTSGEVALDINGPDSYSSEAMLAIGTGASTRPESAARAKPARTRSLPAVRPGTAQ